MTPKAERSKKGKDQDFTTTKENFFGNKYMTAKIQIKNILHSGKKMTKHNQQKWTWRASNLETNTGMCIKTLKMG